MIIFVLIVGLICLYKMQFAFSKKNKPLLQGGIYNDYLSIDKTNSIKGIFVPLIVLSHALGYITLDYNIFNRLFDVAMYRFMGQGIVAMFLFYSGYAMMLSGMKKGRAYIKSIPAKRCFRVWLHFAVAIVLFVIVHACFGEFYSFERILKALTAVLGSVGNSNWYIFAIIVLYFITYIAFMLGKGNGKVVVLITCALIAVYIIVMRHFEYPAHWYDSVHIYPLGMLWCMYREKIENMFKNKKWTYYLIFAVIFILYIATVVLSPNIVVNMIKHALFGIVIVLFTMKVQVHNKILGFFGKHLFSIYILQRIPMFVLSHFGLNSNPYLFVFLALVLTIAISVPFDMLLDKLDSYIFKSKKIQK